MTRFENLARLLPLHIQRIAELTFECDGDTWSLEQPTHDHRGNDLLCLFVWADTPEGDDYWNALAKAAVLP